MATRRTRKRPTFSLDDGKAIDNNEIDRRINDFAVRAFRDMAHRDYLTARLACRADLISQFLWSAQQAIEKYLKCILLLKRIRAKNVRHDINEALKLLEKLTFKVCWASCSSTCSFRMGTSMLGGNICACCAPIRRNDHRPPQKVAGLKQRAARQRRLDLRCEPTAPASGCPNTADSRPNFRVRSERLRSTDCRC